MNPILKDKIARLPKEPGCYLMKDAKGHIIYAGKAKSLKSRVSSYFGAKGQLHFKTLALVEEIYDFEVIITQTEVESLLLERTLIKHHKPKFNILLRDDKEYPYLRIGMNEEWPRIEKVRRRQDDGAVYLGPFGSAGQLKILLDATYRIFPLIRCSRHEFETVRRPCNYYHMKMCLGPCKLPVEKSVYRSMMEDAIAFLSGRNKEVVKNLKIKMGKAADDENFELAAVVRDQLQAFENVTEKQSVVVGDIEDTDVIGYAHNETRAAFHVLMVRDGFLIGGDGFVIHAPIEEGADAVETFLLQFYDARSVPADILVPMPLPAVEELRQALLASHPEAAKLAIKDPARGTRHDLIEMANKNARHRLDDELRLGERRRTELAVLQDKLKLKRFPRRMECIDISNIQGTAIVASNVCFVDGRPAKEFYRHYIVDDLRAAGPDDFGSIREIVRRRLERGVRDADLPDLLIIDGGRGQLSAALDSFKLFPDVSIDLVSLAKSKVEKDRRRFIDSSAPERSFERVFFPGIEMPTALATGTPEFRLLTQIRDEAHRFAITHHRKRRSKISHGSALEDIPGIGPALRQKLLTAFSGLDGLKRASLSDLTAVKGMRESSAIALFSYFRSDEDGGAASEPSLPPEPLGEILPQD